MKNGFVKFNVKALSIMKDITQNIKKKRLFCTAVGPFFFFNSQMILCMYHCIA